MEVTCINVASERLTLRQMHNARKNKADVKCRGDQRNECLLISGHQLRVPATRAGEEYQNCLLTNALRAVILLLD